MFCLSLLKLFPVNSSCLRGRRPGCYACHRRYAADQPYSSSPLLVYHRNFNLVYFNKAVYIHYYYLSLKNLPPWISNHFLSCGGGGEGKTLQFTSLLADEIFYEGLKWGLFLQHRLEPASVRKWKTSSHHLCPALPFSQYRPLCKLPLIRLSFVTVSDILSHRSSWHP